MSVESAARAGSPARSGRKCSAPASARPSPTRSSACTLPVVLGARREPFSRRLGDLTSAGLRLGRPARRPRSPLRRRSAAAAGFLRGCGRRGSRGACASSPARRSSPSSAASPRSRSGTWITGAAGATGSSARRRLGSPSARHLPRLGRRRPSSSCGSGRRASRGACCFFGRRPAPPSSSSASGSSASARPARRPRARRPRARSTAASAPRPSSRRAAALGARRLLGLGLGGERLAATARRGASSSA